MRPRVKIAAGMAIAAALVVLSVFWLAGFDFDERGLTAAMCFALTLAVAWLAGWIGYNLKRETDS